MLTSEKVFNFLHDHYGLPIRSMTVFNYLLEATLCGAALILIVLFMRRFLRPKLGNRAIYLAWLLVALRLLLPVALPNPLMNELRPTLSTDAEARPIADQIRVRFQDGMSGLSRAIDPERGGRVSDGYTLAAFTQDIAAYTSYGWTGKWFLFAYLAADGGVAIYMVVQNVLFRRRLRRGRVSTLDGNDLAMYRALCVQRKVKPIPVYYIDPLPSACLVGVLRPYIALPLTLKPEALRQVLLHELCHHKGHDEWWGLLRDLCCVAHWFNPLVWIGAQCSRVDCELACDDRVTARMTNEERLAYANTLVLAASRRDAPRMSVLATGMTMTGKRLKQRVNAILRSQRVRRWVTVTFMLLAMGLTVLVFATAESREESYDILMDKAKYGWLMDDPFSVTVHDIEPIQRGSLQNEAEAEAYARTLATTPYFNRRLDATTTLTVTRGGDEWRAAGPGVDDAFELHFDKEGKLLYYNARIYRGYAEYPYPPTDSIRTAVQLYMTAFARDCLGLTLSGVTLDEDGYELDGRFILGRGLNADGSSAFSYMLDLPTMTVLRYYDSVEATWRRGTPFSEAVALMRDDITETSIYSGNEPITAEQLEQGAFAAQRLADGAWVVTFTIPANALTKAQLHDITVNFGAGDPVALQWLGTPYNGRFSDYRTLSAYLHRDDPVITREAANVAALDAIVAAYQRPVSDFVVSVADYEPTTARYTVHYELGNATGAGPSGMAYVDMHTGEVSAVLETREDGSVAAVGGARAVELPPPGAIDVTPPDSTDAGAEAVPGREDASDKNPAPDRVEALHTLTLPEKDGVALTVQAVDISSTSISYGPPPEGALALEEAISLAMDQIADKYGVTRQDLANGYINYAFMLPDHWWLNFVNQSRNEIYSASVYSPDGARIESWGPDEGNG